MGRRDKLAVRNIKTFSSLEIRIIIKPWSYTLLESVTEAEAVPLSYLGKAVPLP